VSIPAPFIGKTYDNTFLLAEQQRCVNWFPKGNTLRAKPGYDTWTVTGEGPIRGWEHHKDVLLVVSATEVYSVSKGGFATKIGELATDIGPVQIASSGFDGNEALFTDGKEGYVWDGSKLIVATGLPNNPHHALFDNGFFGVIKGDSAEFYKATNPFDAINWAGEFATIEQSPDKVEAVLVNRNDLWMLGERSLEVWFYSGEAFPWNPNRSAFQDYGIAAPETLTKFDNNVAWLADSGEVGRIAVKTQGFAVQRISNSVIEKEWQSYEKISDATAWSFKFPGLGQFLVFQFPSGNATWIFDAEEGQWHEWQAWHPMGAKRRHTGKYFVHFDGRYLISDHYNGNIYQLKDTLFQDNGVHSVKKRMGPNLISSRNSIVYSYLELIMAVGVGKAGSEDPKVRLSYSDDRGHVWSNFQEHTLGGIGNRMERVGFSRLGSSKERIFQVEVASDVETTLTDSIMQVEEGML